MSGTLRGSYHTTFLRASFYEHWLVNDPFTRLVRPPVCVRPGAPGSTHVLAHVQTIHVRSYVHITCTCPHVRSCVHAHVTCICTCTCPLVCTCTRPLVRRHSLCLAATAIPPPLNHIPPPLNHDVGAQPPPPLSTPVYEP